MSVEPGGGGPRARSATMEELLAGIDEDERATGRFDKVRSWKASLSQ
jgi:hypothetical protein